MRKRTWDRMKLIEGKSNITPNWTFLIVLLTWHYTMWEGKWRRISQKKTELRDLTHRDRQGRKGIERGKLQDSQPQWKRHYCWWLPRDHPRTRTDVGNLRGPLRRWKGRRPQHPGRPRREGGQPPRLEDIRTGGIIEVSTRTPPTSWPFSTFLSVKSQLQE